MTHAISRYSFVLFAAFLLAAIIAFWPNYFSSIFGPTERLLHLHGIPMTLWCVLLVVQGMLIRTKNHALHKTLGYSSLVLVPIILLTTLQLINDRMGGPGPMPPIRVYSITLMLNATLAFAVLYMLALINRKKVKVHMRYMLGTIFPLFSPVTDRLIYFHFPDLVKHAPAIDGYPIVPFFGFVLGDVVLLILFILDWRAKKKTYTFLVILLIMGIYHVSVFFWKDWALWANICTYLFGQ